MRDCGISSAVLAPLARGHPGWPRAFGSALGAKLDPVVERWNRFGLAGFTFAIFTILFWMVPRSIDSAVTYPGYETIKFVTMPCAGAALALSFPRTHPVFAGAFKANLVSMAAVLAWVYTVAPVRLCNSYLSSDQKMLGTGMAVLVGVVAIHWGVGLLFGANAVRFHPGHRQLDHTIDLADYDFNSVGAPQ